MFGVLPSVGADPIPVTTQMTTGDQVAVSGEGLNGTDLIYTVTAGKTLYLVSILAQALNMGAGYGKVFVTDDLDVEQYVIFGAGYGSTNLNIPFNFCPPAPMEIPAGYKIKTLSPGASNYWEVFVFGYEL